MRRRVSAATEILEKTDARQRKERRKHWKRKGRRQRRLHPQDAPAAVRRRIIERALFEAGVAAGTVEAFELLQSARDDTNRRLMHFAALPLLRSYLADAKAPAGTGWQLVPTDRTQRERADALDLSDKYIRDLNRDLVSAGLLRDGGLHYHGDGARGFRRLDGKRYVVPLKRRVWWLAPAVVAIVARAAQPDCKSGNPFPAGLISDQPLVLDPSSSAVCASSGSLPFPFPPLATDRSSLDFPASSPPFSPGSAVDTKRSEGAAVAAPVDQLQPAIHPPLELITADRATERPTAAPRGGAASLDPPSMPIPTADVQAPVAAGAVPSPDPSTVSQQTGGSPPPITPPDLFNDAGDRVERSPLPAPPPLSPDSAFNTGPSSTAAPGASRSTSDEPSAPRPLRGDRASSPRFASPPLRRGYAPEPARGHHAGCDCLRCWVAASVRAGIVTPRPHPVGHRCSHCWAWANLTMKQWKRYRDPSKAPRLPSPAAAPDPTLQLLQRLGMARGSGALTQADWERLGGLVLDGRELEVAAELDAALSGRSD